jgi:hypothetical protein
VQSYKATDQAYEVCGAYQADDASQLQRILCVAPSLSAYILTSKPQGSSPRHTLGPPLMFCRLHHHLAVLGNRSLAFDPVVIDDTVSGTMDWHGRSARTIGRLVESSTHVVPSTYVATPVQLRMAR